ncbi:MAG: CBS domain-containing protein [Candidatus Omnitrophica bacterium]|nr:CBS domain-containing protein [Candidatus Omnitrophota bacterium]
MEIKDLMNRKVNEIMTRQVLTTRPEALVRDVARRMALMKIGASVVVNDQEKVVGIFTERDLLKYFVAQGDNAKSITIEEAMTKSPVTLGRDEDMTALLQSMESGKFRHLPVVHDGKLVGIVSIRDAFKMLGELVQLVVKAEA